jgi:ribosomal protein S18 acetylase RimI-like enzyme
MNYKTRQATAGDYKFCHDITKQNMYDLLCKHWGGWVDSAYKKGFVVDNIEIVLGDNKPVGYLSCKKEKDYIYIDNIQISSSFQGQGIGTSILKSLLDKHSKCLVQLTTFENNPAKRLYERLGFIIFEKDGFTIKMERKAQQNGCRNAHTSRPTP